MNSLKKITILFYLFSLLACTQDSVQKASLELGNNWDRLEDVLKRIVPPQFPDKDFNIVDFGGVADGKTDNSAALDKAIIECNSKGGGRVIVPEGTYVCNGPIKLKSNVNLHIMEGAVIKFSTNPKDYLPVVFARWEGVECYNYSSLIYAKDIENIAVTGKGILDGQADNTNWWSWKGKKEMGWKEGMPSQSDNENRPSLMKMNNQNEPVEKRIFGDGHYLRPNFFQTINCKNILVEGVTFINSPMWFLHPVLSQNITIRDVSINGLGPNNDGCDPESCKDVLIQNCNFNTGDDCIALKSGRNTDGRRINQPCENIVIQDCMMKEGHGGVVMGSEISGGCKNVFVENCVMDSPNLDRAIRLKSNSIRGGTIENIFVRNVTVGQVGESVIKINMKYDPKEAVGSQFWPIMKNIDISGLKSKKSTYGLFFDGLDSSKIQNIAIRECAFDGVEKGNILNNVENLEFDHFYINGVEQHFE